MVLLHRKTIFLVFFLITITLLLVLSYFSFLHQPVITKNSHFDFIKNDLVFHSNVVNVSGHLIENVEFSIVTDDEKYVNLIKSIKPDENVPVSLRVPISDSLRYEVFVSAPFSKPFYFPFKLDPQLVEPVDTNLIFPPNLKLNKENDLKIEVCNVSESDIINVEVSIDSESGYFNKPIIPSSINLSRGQCKTLNYTLTPINQGEVTFLVVTKAHQLELYKEKTVVIK